MPKVSGEKFPYTPKGVAAAKKAAAKTGAPMEMHPPKKMAAMRKKMMGK